jgi:hypothetical protein
MINWLYKIYFLKIVWIKHSYKILNRIIWISNFWYSKKIKNVLKKYSKKNRRIKIFRLMDKIARFKSC